MNDPIWQPRGADAATAPVNRSSLAALLRLAELGLTLRFPVAIPFYQRHSSRPAEVPPLGPAAFEAAVLKMLEGLSPDDVLDNATLYWLTGTAVSSARLYWENKLGFFDVKHVQIPVAVSAFPSEIFTAPQSWAAAAYPNLIYFHQAAKGGHFAAWEQPQLFSEEVRAGFRSLRSGMGKSDVPFAKAG